MELTGAAEFHIYLTKQVPSVMKFTRNGVSMGKPGLSEYETLVVDRERIQRAKEILMKSR
jgi:hypothetical protein